MRILLINPNTSAHITSRLAASARKVLEPGDELTAVTGSEGPPVVCNADTLAHADSNALALARAHTAEHDAVVLAISLDGATRQLRSTYPNVPFVGMTEAALLTACVCAERIGVLTLGADLLPLYRRRVDEIGLASRVVAYRTPEVPRAFVTEADMIDPVVLDVLTDSIGQMKREGAQVIVLAGAVLCGYAEALTSRCGLLVLDGVACAVGQLRNVVACRMPLELICCRRLSNARA